MMAVNNAPMQLDNVNWRDLGTDYENGARVKEMFNVKQQEKILNGIMQETDPAKQLELAQNSKHAAKLLPAVQAHQQAQRDAVNKNLKAEADLTGVNATTDWTQSRNNKTRSETVGVGYDNAGKLISNKNAVLKGSNDAAESQLKQLEFKAKNALAIEQRLANAALGAQHNPQMFLNQLNDLLQSGQISEGYARALHEDVIKNGGVNASAMLKAYSKSTTDNFKAQLSTLSTTNLGGQTVFNSYNGADGTLTGVGVADNSLSPDKKYAVDGQISMNADDNLTAITNNINTVKGSIQNNEFRVNNDSATRRWVTTATLASNEGIADTRANATVKAAEVKAKNAPRAKGVMPPSSTYNNYIENEGMLEDVKHTVTMVQDLRELIGSGKLNLGYAANIYNEAAGKYGGSSSENVLALRKVRSKLDELKNAALRLNKGTQTDKDYERIAKEIEGFSFPTSNAQALQQIQFITTNMQAKIARMQKQQGMVKRDFPGLVSSGQQPQQQQPAIRYGQGGGSAMPPPASQRGGQIQYGAPKPTAYTKDNRADFFNNL